MKTDKEIYLDYCKENNISEFEAKYYEGLIIKTLNYCTYKLKVRLKELFDIVFSPIINKILKSFIK